MENGATIKTTPDTGSRGERLRLRFSAILWFLAIVGLLLSLPVLFDIAWWAAAIVAAVALVVAVPIAWLVRRLFSRQRQQRPSTSYAKAVVASFSVLAILIATPFYFLAFTTALRPMTVPQVTLSDGTKTVVFQGMMHIGSEGFYKSVVYDVEEALSEGYTIFYEGVRPDPAGDTWFSDTLAGGGDLSANYSKLGNACGLTFQGNYFQLLAQDMAAHPERHVAADVTTADMMREYDRLVQTDPDFAAEAEANKAPADKAEAGDDGAWLFTFIDSATPGQRALVGTACRGWMTLVLGRKTAPSPLDPVILDYRNRELAERIISAPQDKIFITYGSQHLPGLLALLKDNNPAWEVKSVRWMRTIDTPEDLSGDLDA